MPKGTKRRLGSDSELRFAALEVRQGPRRVLYSFAADGKVLPRFATADIDDYFSAPATRRAAHYLRGRLRTPAADLPPDDEALARLVAELVVTAGTLEATVPKLELEELQLDLHRLERHISEARLSGATGVSALAAQRQRVLDEIRHRLT